MGQRRSPFYLVIDLETVPDPELPQSDENKFPPPVHHKIACAGYAFIEDHHISDWGVVSEPEPDILRRLVLALDSRPVVVGMNSRGFDLPVIAARCLVHGIPFPWYYGAKRNDDARYRYGHARHLDVIDYLSDYGAAPKSSLDTWARAIGLPGKQGTDGTQVAEMFAEGRHEAIADYCMRDVAQTIGLLLRVELLRGAISLAEFADRARSFLDKCWADVRTAGLASTVNLDRFLCTGSTRELIEAAE